MSAKKETDFPGFYNPYEAEDWFKRCLEDYPVNYMMTQDRWVEQVEEWKEKWLSQLG